MIDDCDALKPQVLDSPSIRTECLNAVKEGMNKVAVLKGHDFSRAYNAAKIIGL